jgi:holo-[acyl-carrier protein] synthase
MITGIGADIAVVSRFEKWVKNEALVHRFFHPGELGILSRPLKIAARSLGVRFAAKEAFGKALGTGLKGFELKDICVVQDKGGKPSLAVYRGALKSLKKNGADTIHVSLSHDGEYALAFVVLEQKGSENEKIS